MRTHTTNNTKRANRDRYRSELAILRLRYHDQRLKATQRGIHWAFTFETWLEWWQNTGKLAERGNRRGQYCMARYGDEGPYAPYNVRCATVEENHLEKFQVRRSRLQ